MRYRIYLILMLFALSGCSSGSSTSGGGSNPVADTGNTGLSITGTITPATTSADCWSTDCNSDNKVTGNERISTDLGTLDVTVVDLYNQYTNVNQGVTFTSYTISYSSQTAGAPALPSRTIATTIQIPLNGNSSASVSTSVTLVEVASTKTTFANLNPSKTPYSYTITLTFHGKDWINNENITMVVKTTMELGDFCPAA